MLRTDAVADLATLQRALEERFAYLKTNDVDHEALFAALRERLPPEVEPGWLGLELQKLLARFVDGHAAINVPPSPFGFLPFLTGWAGDGLVAYEADRSRLLDPERPFLSAIDGLPVTTWLEAAGRYVAAGSPQLVRREALRWLRAVRMLRRDLGLPERDDVEVVLTRAGGAAPRTLRLAVTEGLPRFGAWPRSESAVLDGDVGYLRLAQMRPEAADDVRTALTRFASTDGLVVDVRGNGGGTRDALLALLPALMAPEDTPRVVNVAAYRAWEGFPDDHLAARHLYPVDAARWSPAERAALDAFMPGFEPEWPLPAGEFSTWHAMVVSPAAAGQPAYRGRPVVVLMDAGCFSATDVFLSALKGVPNVTLLGEGSSGGSARAQVVELPASGLKARFASMASFQASGELFDGRGVRPDATVLPEPGSFLESGRDVALERALGVIRERAPERPRVP